MENLELNGIKIGYASTPQSITDSNGNPLNFDASDAHLSSNHYDLVLCGYFAGQSADLSSEISGYTSTIARMVAQSTILSTIVISGLKTHLNGLKHLSCVVSYKNKLIDIVDRTLNVRGDEYLPTNKIKLYNIPKGVVGLLVDTDILLEQNWKRIAQHCDIIVSVALELSAEDEGLIAALSNKYKTPCFALSQLSEFWCD